MPVPNLPILVFQRSAVVQGTDRIWIPCMLMERDLRVWSSSSHEDIVLDFSMYSENRRGIFPYKLIVLYAGMPQSQDHQYSMWIVRQLYLKQCSIPLMIVTSDHHEMQHSLSGWEVECTPVITSTGDFQLLTSEVPFRVYLYPNPVQPEQLVHSIGRILLSR